MTSATRNILIYSLTFAVGMVGLYGYGVYVVQQKGNAFFAVRESYAEQTAKEAAYMNLLRIIEDSREDRARIESFFLTEPDTISLITNIEQFARQRSLAFETTQLAVVQPSGSENQQLNLDLRFAGSEQNVRQFIRYIETLPYRKQLNTIELMSAPDAQDWRGQISLSFTLIP